MRWRVQRRLLIHIFKMHKYPIQHIRLKKESNMRNTDSKIVETFASKEYITITPQEILSPKQERLTEDTRPFNYITYSQEIHSPEKVDIGFDLNLENMPRCLDMPLRLSGDTEYRLPTDWKQLEKVLTRIFSIEAQHNPNWKEYNTYLTVDYKPVTVGEQQRHGGLHVDGFQGDRIKTKTKITRNYVATTNGGTQFWNQNFIVADPKLFNVFKGFDLQIDGDPFIAEENQVYFMDAYTVHESGFASFNGDRVFFRVTFDLKEFDRLGNTHNPNLNYSWDMVQRNAQELVKPPRLTDIIDSPYFVNPT